MDEQAGDVTRQILPVGVGPIPVFAGGMPADLRDQMARAVNAWMLRTTSRHTRRAYASDLNQFLTHAGIRAGARKKGRNEY